MNSGTSGAKSALPSPRRGEGSAKEGLPASGPHHLFEMAEA